MKVINNKRYLSYEIITGKGNNSTNKKPKIFPELNEYFTNEDFTFKPALEEGRILLYLPFNWNVLLW